MLNANKHVFGSLWSNGDNLFFPYASVPSPCTLTDHFYNILIIQYDFTHYIHINIEMSQMHNIMNNND